MQILKNNIKNSFYKGICRTRPIQNSPTGRFIHLGLVRQKTRSLIYYYTIITHTNMYVRNVADCKKIEYVIKIKSTNIPITHVNHLFLTFNVLDFYNLL
jgi:dihydrodipicolinate synthase/N-acetylneuraminate lyase